MSESSAEFFQKLMANMTEKNIYQIEKMTQGQSDCDMWFYFRKGVVTSSKFHNVLTKMAKISKVGGGYVDMFQLNQSVSGLKYVPKDLPALKYGRDMEKEVAITFLENMKAYHENPKLKVCGLFLDKCPPFIGVSPDRIFECDCCPPACVEIKYPYSINHTSPSDPDVSLPYIKHDNSINENHQYFTQCMVQMGVMQLSSTFFVVWTPHGHIVKKIAFDSNLWLNMKETVEEYYKNFYLNVL